MEVFIGTKFQRKGAGLRKYEFLRWQPPVPGCRSNGSGLRRQNIGFTHDFPTTLSGAELGITAMVHVAPSSIDVWFRESRQYLAAYSANARNCSSVPTLIRTSPASNESSGVGFVTKLPSGRRIASTSAPV